MKIPQPEWDWGDESHKELKSLLHSIPGQEHWMKALGESEIGLWEWRKWACSTENCNGQLFWAIGGGGVFIELSQETSHWAHIPILDIVQLSRTLSGQGFLWIVFEFWSGSSRAGQCPAGGFCLWMTWKGFGVARLKYFHFIHHTPLSSTVFLYSRNIKTTSLTWACINIEPCHLTSFWLHEGSHFWSYFGIDSLKVVTWSTPHRMINFHFWYPRNFISWFNRDWNLVIYESS
jgi:hypothetical protein